MSDVKKIETLLSRYVEKIYPSLEALKETLVSGRKLVFYLGIDPTGPDIHIGHSTNLLWLKKFQELENKVILLIGDFTARVGDPDKESVRKALSTQEVEQNMKTYLAQAKKILPEKSFEVRYNSQWLAKLTLEEIIKLASHFTVQQMIVRDMFQERLNKEKPIYLHEFFYPLMQGYDSVAMEVDGEIGGDDQTFNMLIGRDLMKDILKKDKFVVTTKLLEDSKTGKKIMNKSEGNVISLNDSPQEIRRKVLSLDDGLVKTVFELCTEKEQDWIDENEKGDPRAFKEALAGELVQMYYGQSAVAEAQKPIEVLVVDLPLPQALKVWGIVSTISAGRDLINNGGVQINGESTDWNYKPKAGDEIKIGKGKFFKVI
ncbi:MAG TPA: tyrosine--tRNA ligase [Candidatus Paceibacterota bacterium]|nr:tyrosine--tRNA ligase [Candidatus Paceibacterota bacterium]